MLQKIFKNEEELEMSELSREQILDLADAAGRKLGFLIALSPLSEEQKQAIITILEYATPEQIDKLTEIFESNYLEADNKELEEKFKSELEKIKAEFDVEQKILDKNTIKKLELMI